MSTSDRFVNRVKGLRQALGWTQEQLAQTAGLSRTGVSAIEATRLVPSVSAALALARAMDCTVEDLFGSRAVETKAQFAWLPQAFPCRYWAAEVGGRTLLFPVESGPCGGLLHDGIARHATDVSPRCEVAKKTLVLASCDPAAGFLASAYCCHGGFRMLVFTRTSGEAVTLVEQGLIHVAGVHFAAADDHGGNAAALASRNPSCELELLRVAKWEEGLACQAAANMHSVAAAAKRRQLRWVGRSIGAGARRCQDELLGPRRTPRRTARDHRGVVEAIRSGWADVGVCLRIATEEGQLAFLPIGEESYDLCIRRDQVSDPRVVALRSTIRSADYRRLLSELPGYFAQSDLGEFERVPKGP